MIRIFKKSILLVLVSGLVLASGCALPFVKKNTGTKWADGVMMRIGDEQIDYREGLVYIDATKRDYEKYYGSGIWSFVKDEEGGTLGDTVKEQILDEMIYIKIVCARAEELHVSLTGDELRAVDEQTDSYMKNVLPQDLIEKKVTRDIIRKIYSDNMLARKVFEQATLNIDTNIPNEEAGQHHLYTIAVRNYKIGASGEKEKYTGQEKEDMLGRMEDLRKNALAAEDFLTYAAKVTEDDSMLDMYAGPGDLDKGIEDRVLSLNDGEMSEVLETEDYLYIFYCKSSFDVDKTLEKKEEIIADRQAKAFESFYASWRESTGVEINHDVWDNMGFEG